MLSMLMITPPRHRGRLASCWRRLIPPPVSAYLDTVANAPFIKIICEQHSRGIDWRMVEAHSLEPSGRLLLPVGVECPAETGMRRFVPVRFVRRMMENLALEALLMNPAPPSEKSLALYGNEAEIIQLLPRIVPLVGEVRIITRRAYALSDIASQTMAQTGMSIVITDEPDAAGCQLLLAPFGGAGCIKTQRSAAVISPDRPCGENAAWISGIKLSVPAALEHLCAGYDPLELTGAFYELAGMRSLGQLSPDYGCCDGEIITSAQLAELIT